MKKFKISIFAIFAIMLGIAGSSFTVKKGHESGPYYFKYNGTDAQGVMTEANWSPASSADENCSNPTTGVNCFIQLDIEAVSGHPDFVSAGIETQNDLDLVTTERRAE